MSEAYFYRILVIFGIETRKKTKHIDTQLDPNGKIGLMSVPMEAFLSLKCYGLHVPGKRSTFLRKHFKNKSKGNIQFSS